MHPRKVNVCFRGQSGHDFLRRKCLLLTQSGHRALFPHIADEIDSSISTTPSNVPAFARVSFRSNGWPSYKRGEILPAQVT
jgi:hypothetical protein